MYDYPAKRSDKIRAKGDDGDTILFIHDQGMNSFGEEPIRLRGVTAPESWQTGGSESAAYLRMICEDIEERARAARRRWAFMVYTEKASAKPEPGERRSVTRYEGTVFAFDAVAVGELSVNDQMAAFLASHPEWGNGITVPFRPRDDGNG